MTPTQIVHAICGATQADDCAASSGLCYVCGGQVTRGKTVSDWMPSTYTDQARVAVPTATHVCEACCFVMSRVSPVPGRPAKDGKQFGGNFRNYSHLWEQGWEAPVFGDDGSSFPGYANASKGQKPLIRAFIERQHVAPWFAAIADSGQKHVLPYVPMNQQGLGGLVLFDEALIRVPTDTGLIGALCLMLTDGATKEELDRGEYRPQTWLRLGRERIREFESTHGRSRGHWFALALWLAQRDEEAVATRLAAEKQAAEAKKQEAKENERAAKQRAKPAAKTAATKRPRADRERAGGTDGGVPGCVPASVQRPTANVVLGPDRKPDDVGGKDQCDSRGMGDQRPARPALGRTVQLGLFGGD